MSNPDGVLDAIDACLEDYAISEDAMRWAPDLPAPSSVVSFRVAFDASTFIEGMTAAARVLTEGFKPIAQAVKSTQIAFHKLTWQRRNDRRHRARCPTCNPAGNPKPMPIDRSEYRRRRR
jgi:hypothetical protein